MNTKNNLIRKTLTSSDNTSYTPSNSNTYQDDSNLVILQSEMKPAVKKFKTKPSPKDSTDL